MLEYSNAEIWEVCAGQEQRIHLLSYRIIQNTDENVKNNIEVDVKIKCIEAGMTQAQLGEAIGTTGQYVNRVMKKSDGVVNKKNCHQGNVWIRAFGSSI